MKYNTQKLQALYDECKVPNWDGYDAHPVTPNHLTAMIAFLKELPDTTHELDDDCFAADPDGCITVEWRNSTKAVFNCSVESDLTVVYIFRKYDRTARGRFNVNDLSKDPFWMNLVSLMIKEVHK